MPLQPSKLLARTRELLQTTLIPIAAAARELEVSPYTLRNIRDGRTDPGVTLCENIYNLLSKTELEVK